MGRASNCPDGHLLSPRTGAGPPALGEGNRNGWWLRRDWAWALVLSCNLTRDPSLKADATTHLDGEIEHHALRQARKKLGHSLASGMRKLRQTAGQMAEKAE